MADRCDARSVHLWIRSAEPPWNIIMRICKTKKWVGWTDAWRPVLRLWIRSSEVVVRRTDIRTTCGWVRIPKNYKKNNDNACVGKREKGIN